MRRAELSFEFPEDLIAIEPREDFRILLQMGDRHAEEIDKLGLWAQFRSGDVLVLNDTAVEKRRVFAEDLEVLFIKPLDDLTWQVLFPARECKLNQQITLPGGITMTLLEKGLPQTVRLSQAIGSKYFALFGEPALPPYIQAARGERHAREQDAKWYQTSWAREMGSSAAPTASLHFRQEDLANLWQRGVDIEYLTLHVGIGTFMPIKAESLDEHPMHGEWAHIPAATMAAVKRCRERGNRVWALGTTVTRALESAANGKFTATESGALEGVTNFFIRPGYEFKFVNGLMTNFHQPESTLLALVAAFAGLGTVKSAYAWAIARRFRLFSYGDLSVWLKP